MRTIARKLLSISAVSISAAALSLIVVLGAPSGARADEADAKSRLKAMSDYMAAQKAISFGFDATLEVVTKEGQTLALASSGTVTLNRPDKIRATRAGGFADIEMIFDGNTLTLFGKTKNIFTQVVVPGTVDELVDVLRDKYNRPLPAADLLMSNAYDELMPGVVDVKDLGSGVIDGVECDYFAFRKKEVDWQIWIAQGDRPYPCRYVITSKLIAGEPQYSIQTRDWKTGDQVAPDDFGFKNETNAKKIEPSELKDMMSDLPKNFKKEDTQ
ncbi:MAG: DUF2092 domain-containing protein [Methyloceanibacter sp.]